MTKDVKLSYLKKATKFLNKNKSVITETQVDEIIIEAIIEDIGFRGNIYN